MADISRLRRCAFTAALALATLAHAQPWTDEDSALALMREQKYADAAKAYAALAEHNPYDGSAWSQLGYSLHADKKYDQALKAYARAIDLGWGRPTNLYNTACALALMGRKDDAITALEKALNARFADQQTLENDTDLDSLRSDPRFAALTGITKGLAADPAPTREQGWAWDLDFLVRRMKQMHWDLYAKVPQSTFLAEIEKLKAAVPSIPDSQVRARLRKITALVGDGHTASRLYVEGEQRRILPIHMFAFKDGLYIIGADKAHADLVGARVLKVGPLDADTAMKAVRPYLSVDNDMGYLAGGPSALCTPSVLLDIGAGDESGAAFTLQLPSGDTSTARLEPASFPPAPGMTFMPGFTYLHDKSAEPRPLYLREPGKILRMEHLPDSKTVYFWFGAIANAPDKSLADFSRDLFAFIEKNDVENLIIDMRFNGGGNTGLIRPLMLGLLKCDAVNRRGHLWVIIGRHTFSAAQNTVNFMDQNTQALFVGEPTGSRPAFVGESTSFMLPHSRTRVFCSSRYWQMMDSTDERVWVHPSIAAEMTFADYAAGRDAATEAIMKWIEPAAKTKPTAKAEPAKNTP